MVVRRQTVKIQKSIWNLLRASKEVTRRARTQAVGNLPQWRFGGLDRSSSGEELLCFVLDAIVVDMECVEKLGLITVQSFHIPGNMTSCHEVQFDTGTVRVTLVSIKSLNRHVSHNVD